MKTQKIILMALTLIAVSVQAKTEVKTKTAADSCAACTQNANLVKDLQKLNINKEDDRFKGETIATKTSDNLLAFAKMPAKVTEREKVFKSLLTLSREASPYDTESQIAQILADMTKKDAGLKKSYDTFVKDMPKAAKTVDFCKSQKLETSVNTQTCRIDVENDKKEKNQAKKEEKIMACTSSFDYADCLKTAKK